MSPGGGAARCARRRPRRRGAVSPAGTALAGLVLVVMLAAPARPAAARDDPAGAPDAGLEISGLVLDESKTKRGRDFFEEFHSRWSDVEGIAYTIAVREQPLVGRSSIIRVDVNDVAVFRARMEPRRAWIEAAAGQAAARAAAHLLEQIMVGRRIEEEAFY